MGDKKIMPLFTVIFEDGTNFMGGTSYFEIKWMEIPYKKIKRIFYRLPGGAHLCLDKYEKYYHMVEATKDWMRISGGKIVKLNNQPKIEYAYIMGKKENIVISYRITLFNKKNDRYRVGDITKREFNINDEKIKKLNPEGWK